MNSNPQFTGERYIPGEGGMQIAYEHVHRYLYAARWAAGGRVLDVATGSGYGAALLAGSAAVVVGVDIDHSSLTSPYRSDTRNIVRAQADATRLPLGSDSMDAVIALEILEHLGDPPALVGELRRVVKPAGVVIVSTPNKAAYSEARRYCNPYHVREFYPGEFRALMAGGFPEMHLLTQQVRAGSLISGAGKSEIMVGRPPGSDLAPVEPMYMLAICSKGAPVNPAPSDSAYFDDSDALLQEWAGRLTGAADEIARLNDEIRGLGRWAESLQDEVAQRDATLRGILAELEACDRTVGERDATIRQLQNELVEETARRDQAIRDLQAQFEERSRWALRLDADVAERDASLRRTNQALDEAAARLARIRHHRLYRALRLLRVLPD